MTPPTNGFAMKREIRPTPTLTLIAMKIRAHFAELGVDRMMNILISLFTMSTTNTKIRSVTTTSLRRTRSCS